MLLQFASVVLMDKSSKLTTKVFFPCHKTNSNIDIDYTFVTVHHRTATLNDSTIGRHTYCITASKPEIANDWSAAHSSILMY